VDLTWLKREEEEKIANVNGEESCVSNENMKTERNWPVSKKTVVSSEKLIRKLKIPAFEKKWRDLIVNIISGKRKQWRAG